MPERCSRTTVAVMGRKFRFGRLASRTRAAKNPTVEEPLERLRDEVARQDEHSHADAAARGHVAQIALEVENEPL
jgi:hypothetical protein